MVIGSPILIGGSGGGGGFSPSDEGKVVSNGALVTQGSQTVTQNGTYDTTLINELIANISGGSGAKNILSGSSVPSASDGSNGDIYLQYVEETLPSGYTKLEYIQFANGTYINTGIAATNHLIEMKVNDLSYTNDKHWFGNTTSNFHPHFTTYSNCYYWGTDGDSEPSGGSWRAGEHILEFNKGSNHAIVLDNVTIGSGKNISTTYNIVIGSRQGTANANNLRVYYFRMYDKGNDVYVRNFVPAKDSNNVIGLYDFVNNVFYDNDGSGSFTAGSEATVDDPITTVYLKVNGTWQRLIGSDIDDVNTGGGVTPETDALSFFDLFKYVAVSKNSGDNFTRNDRSFTGGPGEPIIALSAVELSGDTIAYSGYTFISFSSSGVTGTSTNGASLTDPSKKTTQNGTDYWIQRMRGMYPPSTDNGKLIFVYGSPVTTHEFVVDANSVVVDISDLEIIGDSDLLSLLESLIDAVYLEYYA